MPQFDNVYPYISYITAAGDEIVLSCAAYKKWWECYGRTGFAAPPLKHITQETADGAMDTLAIELQARTLKIQMVISGGTSLERDTILNDIASRLLQIGHRQSWGKLKILKTNGNYVYIDCAYIGGMDEISVSMPRAQLFELSFYAGKACFYDETETTYNIVIYNPSANLLHFGNGFHFGAGTHFLSAGAYFTENIQLEGFRAYPVITITGRVGNVSLENAATGRIIDLSSGFSLRSGETVVIDTTPQQRSVTITRRNGTEENGYNYLSPDTNLDWFLTGGVNEVIYCQPDNNPDTSCVLRYQQMRLSA